MRSWRSWLTIRSRAAGRSLRSNSTAIALFSTRSARAALLAVRTAIGSATSAVMITATTAVAAVTRTTRPDSVRKKSRIGGVTDPADRADQVRRRTELRAHLRHVHVDRTGAGVRRV